MTKLKKKTKAIEQQLTKTIDKKGQTSVQAATSKLDDKLKQIEENMQQMKSRMTQNLTQVFQQMIMTIMPNTMPLPLANTETK